MNEDFLKISSTMGDSLSYVDVTTTAQSARERRVESTPDAQNADGVDHIVRVTLDPPPSLRQYIDHFWTLQDSEDRPLAIEMFANDVSGILFQQCNGGSALSRPSGARPASANGIPQAFVYGKRTRPASLIARGPFELIGVVFRSQGLPALLAIDAADVNNGPVNVDDVFGGSFGDQLLSARSAAHRLEVLAQSLNARAEDRRRPDPLVEKGLRLLR